MQEESDQAPSAEDLNEMLSIVKEAAVEDKTVSLKSLNGTIQQKGDELKNALNHGQGIIAGAGDVGNGLKQLADADSPETIFGGAIKAVTGFQAISKNLTRIFSMGRASKSLVGKTASQASTGKEIGEVAIGHNPTGLPGALNDIIGGAVGGAVIGVGMSTVQNHKLYKEGVIDKKEFKKRIKEDGIYGSTVGGVTSGALHLLSSTTGVAIGLANPITIPVMMIVAGGVNKILAPGFKRGIYKELEEDFKATLEFEDAMLNYFKACQFTFKYMLHFSDQVKMLNEQFVHEIQIGKEIDGELDEKLETAHNIINTLGVNQIAEEIDGKLDEKLETARNIINTLGVKR